MQTVPCYRDKGEEGGRAEGGVGQRSKKDDHQRVKSLKGVLTLKTDIHSLTKKEQSWSTISSMQ